MLPFFVLAWSHFNENGSWNKNNIHTNTQGFPTLVWGDIHFTEIYNGPRDYVSLSAHAKEHISKPICSLYHLEACSDEETTIIEWLQAKSDEEMEEMVHQVMELVQHENTVFDEKNEAINLLGLNDEAHNEKYDALVIEFNSKMAELKTKFHYNFVEQIIAKREAEKNAAGKEL